ncbi:synaptophysin-like protein 2 [Diabrotica undecimpunctata]|uniref:synaptophysin-like protein 2 n=1 Tax=Diabrotica undecimpunctata TaxID=50387 RepID=UPI003B638C28
MDFNLAVFQEPRGVMRIVQFIFSICAFATITGYTGFIQSDCQNTLTKHTFVYPFEVIIQANISTNCSLNIVGDFSSDAKFFVTTGVLSMLYSLAIMVVYTKLDKMYKSNAKIPLIDFVITVIFAVLWLSSSAAWANGLTGLKTDTTIVSNKNNCANCNLSTSSYSTLNISVIFGFLNFFLWASDLWFLYKETSWFQGNRQTGDGV